MSEQRQTRRDNGRRPSEHRRQANGIELCYLEWAGPASPTRPPVVLLHGLLQTGEGVANLATHLARDSRVIAPDLRGRGGSEQPAEGYDPGTLADDVAALIEGIGLERPVVIGRLHGGLVAYHLAARRPELVGGLVIGDTPPEVDETRCARSLAMIRSLPARFATLDEALTYYQEKLGLSEARARHDIPFDLIREEDGGYHWRHNLALIEQIERASMPRADWDVLARIASPTLLLRGQRGEIPAAMAERVCQTIVQAPCRVQTVLGARHDVFLGPGCEQAFGAIDLFMMSLPAPSRSVNSTAVSADPPSNGPAGDGAEIVERMVRAVNSRDSEAITSLFVADGRIVQYGEGGLVREGGLDAARSAFDELFTGAPAASIEVRDVVFAGDRIACVFAIRKDETPLTKAPPTILAPTFLRLRDGQIAEIASYLVHQPGGLE